MILYVIRHGESMANVKQSDEADCSLSKRGELQALSLPVFFENIRIDKIFSSPLRRTILTASPLAKRKKLPIVLVPELAEFFNLEWTAYRDHQWLPCQALVSGYEGTRFVESHDPKRNWWPVWPEARDAVGERVVRFYNRELTPLLGTDERIAVFGHGATTNDLKELVYPHADYPPLAGATNAVIYEFELGSGGICESFRVHSGHLQGL